jgi:hypothetical protein
MTWQVLPLALRVKCGGWPAIWLPVIVLWPVILVVFGLALPLCMLVPAPRSALAALAASYRMLCAMHGTEFELGTSAQRTWSFSLY